MPSAFLICCMIELGASQRSSVAGGLRDDFLSFSRNERI